MKKENYLVIVEGMIPCIGRDDNEIYRSGSPSLVFYPIFDRKEDARKFGRRAKKKLEGRWYKVVKGEVF